MRSAEFRDGYQAYLCGLSINDNPYDTGFDDDSYNQVAESEEWEAGYYQAMEDD